MENWTVDLLKVLLERKVFLLQLSLYDTSRIKSLSSFISNWYSILSSSLNIFSEFSCSDDAKILNPYLQFLDQLLLQFNGQHLSRIVVTMDGQQHCPCLASTERALINLSRDLLHKTENFMSNLQTDKTFWDTSHPCIGIKARLIMVHYWYCFSAQFFPGKVVRDWSFNCFIPYLFCHDISVICGKLKVNMVNKMYIII